MIGQPPFIRFCSFLRKYLLLLGLVAWAGVSSGQSFRFQNYSVGEGLAQSQVFAVLEDSRGYLWMGTRGGGLCRFDGKSFKTYQQKDGLVNNYILCLFEDPEGRLWIGTNNGLSIFDGTTFTNLHPDTNYPTLPVGKILQDSQGNLWIGTSKGLFKYVDGKFETVIRGSKATPNNISDLLEDPDHGIWIATDNGLHLLQEDTIRTYTTYHGLTDNHVQCLARDADGRLWIGTYGGGVTLFDGNQVSRLPTKTSFRTEIILDIFLEKNGQAWIATPTNGVVLWNPSDSSLTYLREKEGLGNNHVRTIMRDSWENLWIGTSGGGISKYTGRQFVHYNEPSGLPGKYVYSVHLDNQGNLWMGTSGTGITRYDGRKFYTLKSDSGFKDLKVKSIFEDREGRLWFGTEGGGLSMYHNRKFRHFTGYNGLGGNWIRDMVQDGDGNLWVATAGGGITKMTPNPGLNNSFEFQTFTARKGLLKDRINCLHIDQSGRLWYGTVSDGVGYIYQDSVYTFDLNDRLSSGRIKSMTEDELGQLWIGTAGGGINRIVLYEDQFEVATIRQEDGLTSDNLYVLEVDLDGHLWAGNESGVDHILLDNSRHVVEVKHYGKAEGFLGIETCQNAVTKGKDGNIWFGTINGLTLFNPSFRTKNTLAPKLAMQKVNLFYEPIEATDYAHLWGSWGKMTGELVLPYNQNHLGFEFIGINHKNPQKVVYKWQLENFDLDWSPVSEKSDVTYSNLPPGDYTFKIQAANEDGVWTEDPYEVRFTILPPVWATWWFRTLAGVFFLLIILLIFRLRIRQVKRKTEQERQRLKMQNSLLELEQKALRLQMNPHFIFNALNSIQALIGRNDDKTARYYLAKFSKLMRLTLKNSRSTTIPLDQEIDSLENYLALEQFSRGDRYDYEIKLADDTDPEEVTIPPMMIQPFLENAIIHGLSPLENRGHILLEFAEESGFLVCKIEDNGVGREKAASLRKKRDPEHSSTALKVTRERLDILNQGKNGFKSLEIIDLKDEEETPTGTRVVLKIPLSEE